MDKPVVGDILKVTDLDTYADMLGPGYVKVVAVFDSLDESWDPYGEAAWGQKDVDSERGKTGEWYIIAYECNFKGEEVAPGETWSLASYEVGM